MNNNLKKVKSTPLLIPPPTMPGITMCNFFQVQPELLRDYAYELNEISIYMFVVVRSGTGIEYNIYSLVVTN